MFRPDGLGFGGPSTPHHLPPNSKALKSWPPLVCKFIESTQWSPRVICFEHNSLLVNNVDLSPHLPLLFYYSTYLKLGRLCRQHFRLSNFKQAYSLFKFFYVVAQILNNFWWIIRIFILSICEASYITNSAANERISLVVNIKIVKIFDSWRQSQDISIKFCLWKVITA